MVKGKDLGLLVTGLVGLGCPVLGIGEAAAAGFLYGVAKDQEPFSEHRVATAIGSLGVAIVARWHGYESLYAPMLNIISNYSQ